MLYEAPTFHVTQDLLSEAMQIEAQTFHSMQAISVQHLEQQSLDLQLQNIQHQDQQFTRVSYQDLQSEVKLLTEEWKFKEKHHQIRKSTKQISFDLHKKHSRKKSMDLPIQDQQPPRKKSLDQQIKGWLSPKRHSIDKQDKQVQVKRFSDQQTEDQPAQGKQSLKQQYQNLQGENQHSKEEKSLTKQIQFQQTQDLQVQEEKSSKQQGEHLQSQIQKHQDWQSLGQQSQDWETQSLGQQSQDWINKDHKAQESNFEMKRSINWESHSTQTQDILEKEFLMQKVIFKQTKALQTDIIPQHHLDQQLQDKSQQNFRSTAIKKEDMQITTRPTKDNMQISTIQTKDIRLVEMKSLCQNSSDVLSEDMKPEFHHCSCQSSVHDESSTCEGSEQDVQQNTSTSSTSYKEDPTLTSCYPKDQQQSEDSD
ncbi:Membrane-spanning 4-domains subfamily A member 14 [Myotis brandtii]|uniref:Membrane-spanning 4-domains subfamily A member 14 n=1 Tax=Myotis brandtii TaxID=109478 RepID=S7MI79_MYOBR|nr:Membrane-spanning 4-domains subfamily A member 14 [Myotis brandtii]